MQRWLICDWGDILGQCMGSVSSSIMRNWSIFWFLVIILLYKSENGWGTRHAEYTSSLNWIDNISPLAWEKFKLGQSSIGSSWLRMNCSAMEVLLYFHSSTPNTIQEVLIWIYHTNLGLFLRGLGLVRVHPTLEYNWINTWFLWIEFDCQHIKLNALSLNMITIIAVSLLFSTQVIIIFASIIVSIWCRILKSWSSLCFLF